MSSLKPSLNSLKPAELSQNMEMKIYDMITTKASLMNSVVESDDAVFKTFSKKELIELLTF